MNYQKIYQNAMLTIIAVLLFGIYQKMTNPNQGKEVANSLPANFQQVKFDSNVKYAIVPVNEDGSTNVTVKKIDDVMDVNIHSFGYHQVRTGYDVIPVYVTNQK